jgi:predicted metal-dependent phosphotriesterase family hydrolase
MEGLIDMGPSRTEPEVGPRGTIQTVVGPTTSDSLGITLVHEHVLIDMYEVSMNAAGVLLDEDLATAELGLFRAAGGQTIVEQTTLGLNPDLEGLRRVSLATGVTIVAGVGIYWRRFRPPWVDAATDDALDRYFDEALVGGVGPSRIRAGIIGEIATGHRDIDAVEERVFQAAARAQRATGVAIATHALFTTVGLAQLDILEAAGADPTRVVIGHADTCRSTDYHDAILARGAWIAFDTIGQEDKDSDAWRVEQVVRLADRGFLNRVLISSDVCKRPALVQFGGSGYAHVLRDFASRLRARGFGDAELSQLLVHNPRRMLTGSDTGAMST